MLSNQAKRQSSFHICAPCRRQYQQSLVQLRSRGRIRSVTSCSISSLLPTPSRPNRRRSAHHDPSPTAGQIEGARSYAGWGKFGSSTIPGKTNSAWGSALKKPTQAEKTGLATPSAWGGGLSERNIPRSKGAEELRLSWEARTRPPKPEPKPEPEPEPTKPEAKDRISTKDKVFTKVKPAPRPAPPGAEFPGLLRRESRDNAFRSTSPFNLPSRDQRLRDKSNRSINDDQKSAGSRSWLEPSRGPRASSRDTGKHPGGGMSNDFFKDDPGFSGPIQSGDSGNRFNEAGRPPTSSSETLNSNEFQKSEGRVSIRPDGDSKVERTNLLQDVKLDVHTDDDQNKAGRTDSRNIPARASDAFEEPVLVRNGRKGRETNKGRPKRSRRISEYDFEDEDFDIDDIEAYRDHKAERRRLNEERRAARAAREQNAPKTIVLPEYITIQDLAEALRIKPKRFLEDLGQLGFENILPDSIMTGETAALVAAEYGFETSLETGEGKDLQPRPPPEDLSIIPLRPPVVTIMGHVDHGKTSILDWMRKSSIAASEHGGITQHIGAFSVKLRTGKTITFLDTPGHAAFLSMRQRGAYATDIVVLVVAVDDSVMPQTIEALKHAQNAKVPIIVAVNKIDLDENRMDHVKQDLSNHGVEIEDFGGDVQVVGVSAKTGQGMDDLEETILTLSEILDLRAELDGMAEGWVLEVTTKKEGRAATILVKRGTLRVGDLIVAGTSYTRVRIMRNEAGADVDEAPPGTAVEIFGGWSEPPVSGDMVLQALDEDKAQMAVNYRLELADRAAAVTQKAEQDQANREKAEKAALEKEMEQLREETGEEAAEEAAEPIDTGPKIANIIVRGDVHGSVEAVSAAIMEIGNNEVRPRILRQGPGYITESDVDMLATAGGYLVNFNNAIPGFIRKKAANADIEILDYNIIYELIDNVKKILSRDLKPITHQRVIGEAEVLQVFQINIVKRQYKNIAGVKVRSGNLTRGGLYRVMRGGEKIHDGKLDALKEGKKNATEIRKGNECGMSFDGFEDFQPGDLIQHYENVIEKRYL